MFIKKRDFDELRESTALLQAQVSELKAQLSAFQAFFTSQACNNTAQKNIENGQTKNENVSDYNNGQFLRSFEPEQLFYPDESYQGH